jgi:hypothetical protein
MRFGLPRAGGPTVDTSERARKLLFSIRWQFGGGGGAFCALFGRVVEPGSCGRCFVIK